MYGCFGDVPQVRCTFVTKWEVKVARPAISDRTGSLKDLSAGESPSLVVVASNFFCWVLECLECDLPEHVNRHRKIFC
jgi:hypothetical protein